MNRDWMDRAACTGEDPELFFSDLVADQQEAMAICASCPVIAQCRADAYATEPVVAHGIRAGLTGNQRRLVRNPRKPKPAYSQAERDEAKTLTRTLTERGVSSRAIAERLGVDKRTILRWRHEYREAA